MRETTLYTDRYRRILSLSYLFFRYTGQSKSPHRVTDTEQERTAKHLVFRGVFMCFLRGVQLARGVQVYAQRGLRRSTRMRYGAALACAAASCYLIRFQVCVCVRVGGVQPRVHSQS